MQVSGSHLVRGPRPDVWKALQDPAVLVKTIPGCIELTEEGPDSYRARVSAGIASITGIYDGQVSMTQQDPPHTYSLSARGQGGPGTIDATATIRLSEAEGGTFVEYDAEAVVGGAIAGVGQRVLSGVAKRNAAQFFTAVDNYLADQPVSAPGEEVPEDPAAVTQVYHAMGTQPAPTVRQLLGAAVMGALIALLGVLVGRLTQRRSSP